jgi:hypothetical protein
MAMRIDGFTFGFIRIDGVIFEHDVVIAGPPRDGRGQTEGCSSRGGLTHRPDE